MALAQKAASSRLAGRKATAAVARPALRKAVVVRAAAQKEQVRFMGGAVASDGEATARSSNTKHSDRAP